MLLIGILIVISIVIFTVVDGRISNDFGFNDKELKYIDGHQDLMTIKLSDHFIWHEDNLTAFQNRLAEDLALNITFELVDSADTPIYHIPSGIYYDAITLETVETLESDVDPTEASFSTLLQHLVSAAKHANKSGAALAKQQKDKLTIELTPPRQKALVEAGSVWIFL